MREPPAAAATPRRSRLMVRMGGVAQRRGGLRRGVRPSRHHQRRTYLAENNLELVVAPIVQGFNRAGDICETRGLGSQSPSKT